MSSSYERLGQFYIGRAWDDVADEIRDDVVLYDSKDLTTHAVVVGMTGSGKTGLSVGVLEEAAIDGIPAVAIDPKGDLGNLMLTFPDFRPADYEPWIDQAEATRLGKSVAELAADKAALWRDGLGEWGQDGSRIERFRDAAEVSIYTPGSNAGLSLSVLSSFDAPSAEVIGDDDAVRERVQAATSGLLALLGVDADPVQSREHILIANLLDRAWREGRSLDLAGLIAEIQQPPFDKLGVIDLDTFFPASDRVTLAMRLNGLLASPGFASWLEGDPLDFGRLLYTDAGRPRISVISIAHLSDAERMFVVTLVLNEALAWMRSQSGTSSLRALLYMDEIFGFFPPTQNPPSKKPMLTLLKQARAYGLGVVLATQNPVDLDYKGLSNCGTWLIGRLQTERDKARVLEGLDSASVEAGQELDRADVERVIGSLDKRVFLMNNVHEDGPVLFHTRWVLSYLAGPLARKQIELLMQPQRRTRQSATRAAPAAVASARVTDVPEQQRPVLPEGIEQLFLPALDDAEHELLYRPNLLATAQLHFKRRGTDIDLWQDVHLLAALAGDAENLDVVDPADYPHAPKTRKRAEAGGRFGRLPAIASNRRAWASARKSLAADLYRHRRLTVYDFKPLKLRSKEGESEHDFRIRVSQRLSERRDLEVEKLRNQYARSLQALEDRVRAAEDRIDRERSELREHKLKTAVSFGSSLLGALLGRKKLSVTNMNRAGRAMRAASRSQRQKDDVERASESLEQLLADKRELEEEFQLKISELSESLPAADIELTAIEIPPLKSDISITSLALVWSPWSIDADGVATPLFERPD